MLKILQASLVTSAVHPRQYPPDDLPQIVFLGRSNVGKSSLINALLNRKSLARTSSAPGKTRLINFYQLQARTEAEEEFSCQLVDLPGYGYAKVSKSQRQEFLQIIEAFLVREPERKFCWQLVDIRHAPSAEDVAMGQILRQQGYRLRLVITKADKLSRGQWERQRQLICRALEVPPTATTLFSAQTKAGREELWRLMTAFCLSHTDETSQ